MLWQFQKFTYIVHFNASEMFEEYKKRILQHCHTLRSKGILSSNISLPTPGRLREECGTVYGSRQLTDSDKQVLRDFFGPSDSTKDFKIIIAGFDIDKFRPLNYYLKDSKIETDAKNIELLAWLTDYKPRPFKEEDFRQADGGKVNNISIFIRQLTKWIRKYRKESTLILFVLGFIIFLLMKIPPGNQCMYWAGDHYEAIDCNKQVFGVQSIALDTIKLNHFKKITKPDTMTTYSIGKVWYIKGDGPKPECFTADGMHPLHPGRDLRPLTLTILRKYFGVTQEDSIQRNNTIQSRIN